MAAAVRESSQERVLALIPAKGGSTRLPRKNILSLGKRPLIGWAADAVRQSGVADRLVLSTDSAEVALVARHCGIEVPFTRPADLGRDPAGVVEVALHALETLEAQGDIYSTLIITLPTCPFRTGEDIRDAYCLFLDCSRPFVISVTRYEHSPFAALKMDSAGVLEPWFPEFRARKSQEMPEAYRANGAVHVLDVAAFRQARTYFGTPLVAYVMPRERSLDIDTEEDLREAESYLRDHATSAHV